MLKQVENWDFNYNDCDEKKVINLFLFYITSYYFDLDINLNKLNNIIK